MTTHTSLPILVVLEEARGRSEAAAHSFAAAAELLRATSKRMGDHPLVRKLSI